MRRIFAIVSGCLILAACGDETSVPEERTSGSVVSAAAANEKTEIMNPPNPCSILTSDAAQAELGVSSVEAALANEQSGDSPAPWTCAYQDGDALISLSAKQSPVVSEQGASGVSSAYGEETGKVYESGTGAGVVNLVHHENTQTIVVSWTGLSWSDAELIVEAIVASPEKSDAERAEIANALAELYVGTARQVAAMGG